MNYNNFTYEKLNKEEVTITGYLGIATVFEIPHCINGKKVTAINKCAFWECKELVQVTIPNGITSIGDFAFYGCKSLESITIPANVIKIGTWAFANCKNLENIIISDSVTNIDHAAFYGCCKLNTKKAKYKVCRIVNGRFFCRGFEYKVGEWTEPIDNPKLCKRGYHFCENLFDVFNYYYGVIDEDIAIFECDVEGTTNEHNGDSKRVCRSLRLTKRLSREEVINLLSGNS